MSDRWQAMVASLSGGEAPPPLPRWAGPATRHVCSDAQAAVEPNDAVQADEEKQNAAV